MRGRALSCALAALLLTASPGSADPAQSRPRIGVAFGGGSARGIAHIGVIRWFEEHRIPIDIAAGTSMGALVGGAFASGMTSDELRALIQQTDWDAMFGSSSFPYKNIRRKEDARTYPSRLEFGLKRGIVPPMSLNDGQQVDLLLARIGAPYSGVRAFDDLPTPFRAIAVDLIKGEKVVLGSGSLSQAMRASMSLPGVFPPVQDGDRVLVDGGALDNIPADVVRDMGADVVIAISVGYAPKTTVGYSLFGLMSQTIDTMMQASTREALKQADLLIPVDVSGFGSLDWRRSNELIDRGYQAAEAASASLLKYAVSETEWQAWLARRTERRRTALPVPQFLSTSGLTPGDAAVAERTLKSHLGKPIDVPALERDLTSLSGLDRYVAINWQIVGDAERPGLLVRAREKPYGPPFFMLGVTVDNTTSNDFRVQVAGRYLALDAGAPGAELRIDGVIGSDPSFAGSWHRWLGTSRFFVRPAAAVEKHTTDFVVDDQVVAVYSERDVFVQGDVGYSVSRISEVTGGIRTGRVDANVQAGSPGLPELGGIETQLRFRWLYDSQDSPVVASHGVRVRSGFVHYLQSPDAGGIERTNDGLSQAEGSISMFWTRQRRNRLFVAGAGGTSFRGDPLPTAQFTVGYPLVLDAFSVGERRGDHFGVLTGGALRQIGRLPDFLGGPIFAGGWLENGAIFDDVDHIDFNTHLGVGLVLDTLIGPVIAGAGIGLDGGWRTFVGVGRILR